MTLKFMPDDIAVVTDNDNRTFYIDIKTTRLYKEKPEVLKYGRIVILKVGGLYYSRTKHVYKSHSGMTDFDIISRGFYLLIYNYSTCNYKFKYIDSVNTFMHRDCVCILANDENEYYWFCGELAGYGRKRELLPHNGRQGKTIYCLRAPQKPNREFRYSSATPENGSRGKIR